MKELLQVTSQTDTHREAHHATDTQACIAIDETLCIEDPHHTEVFLPIPEITVHPDHAHHTKNNCITSSKPPYSSNQTAWKNKDRNYKQVTIDDPTIQILQL